MAVLAHGILLDTQGMAAARVVGIVKETVAASWIAACVRAGRSEATHRAGPRARDRNRRLSLEVASAFRMGSST
jgi:hypothetical protein